MAQEQQAPEFSQMHSFHPAFSVAASFEFSGVNVQVYAGADEPSLVLYIRVSDLQKWSREYAGYEIEERSVVLPGSFASPEAIAQIMTQKFVMDTPLYHQELECMGVHLSR